MYLEAKNSATYGISPLGVYDLIVATYSWKLWQQQWVNLQDYSDCCGVLKHQFCSWRTCPYQFSYWKSHWVQPATKTVYSLNSTSGAYYPIERSPGDFGALECG